MHLAGFDHKRLSSITVVKRQRKYLNIGDRKLAKTKWDSML
jgi:hypothetical protein